MTRPSGPVSLAPVSRHLPVADAERSRAFYRDVLGFDVRPGTTDDGVKSLAEVLWGPARIRLVEAEGHEGEGRSIVTVVLLARTARHTGITSSEFYIAHADALHEELVASGAAVRGEPVSYPWGMRAFVVEDSWENRLTFIQTFE